MSSIFQFCRAVSEVKRLIYNFPDLVGCMNDFKPKLFCATYPSPDFNHQILISDGSTAGIAINRLEIMMLA